MTCIFDPAPAAVAVAVPAGDLATIVHDLRSPAAFIAMGSRIIRDQWKELSDHERGTLLDRIAAAGDRLSRLAAQLLEAAGAGAGAVPAPFDVAELVRATVAEAAVTAGGPSGETLTGPATAPVITVTVDPGVPPASGDEAATWRVLGNLVSNALKFSPAGEPVAVAVTAGDGEVVVTVTDRGPGFLPADGERLFRRFSRLGPAGDGTGPAGNGLGLYIARTLVEAQHGRIWAESSPGEGATFGFALPAAGPGPA